MNKRILRVFSVFMFACCLALFVTGCHDKYREGRFCATGKIIVDLDLEDGVEIPVSASSYRVIVYDSNGVQLMATAAMSMPFKTVVLECVPVEATTLVLEFRDADDALVAKSTQKVEITLWSVQRVTITNFDNPPGTTGTLKVNLELEEGVEVPDAASTYRVIVYDSNGVQVAASATKDVPFETVVVEDVPVEATTLVLEFLDDDNDLVVKATKAVGTITPGEVTEVTVTNFDDPLVTTGTLKVNLELEGGVKVPDAASTYRVIVYDSDGVRLISSDEMSVPFKTVVLEGVPVEANTLVLEFRDEDNNFVVKSTKAVGTITPRKVTEVTVTNFDNPPGTTGTLKVNLDEGLVVPSAASNYRVFVYDSTGVQVAASERKDMPFETVVIEDVRVDATTLVLKFSGDYNNLLARATKVVGTIIPGEVTEVTVTEFDKLPKLHLKGCYSGDDAFTKVAYTVVDKEDKQYEGTVAFSATGEYDIVVDYPYESISVKSVVLKNEKGDFEWFDYSSPKTGSDLTLDIADNEFANGRYASDELAHLVANPRQLNNVRYHLRGRYVQSRNIDFGKSCGIEVTVENEAYCAKDYNTKAPFYHIYNDGSKVRGWVPIGSEEGKNYEDEQPFKGTYEGGEYKISNLICDRWRCEDGNPRRSGAGLFGFTSGATLKKIHTDGTCVVIAYRYAGLVVGFVTGSGTVNSCSSSGKLYVNGSSGGIVGGVGANTKGTITSCQFKGNLEAQREYGKEITERILAQCIGGIVGQVGEAANFTVSNCSFSGSMRISPVAVSSSNSYFKFSGGILGSLDDNSSFALEGCINDGTMQFGAYRCGGIAGTAGSFGKGGASLTITDCQVTGTLNFDSSEYNSNEIGGLVGFVYNVPVFTSSSCSSQISFGSNSNTIGGILGFTNSGEADVKKAMSDIGETGTAGGNRTKKIGKYCGSPYVQSL